VQKYLFYSKHPSYFR